MADETLDPTVMVANVTDIQETFRRAEVLVVRT